jgi:hypothetical protein
LLDGGDHQVRLVELDIAAGSPRCVGTNDGFKAKMPILARNANNRSGSNSLVARPPRVFRIGSGKRAYWRECLHCVPLFMD